MSTYDDTARAYITAWNTRDAAERTNAVAVAFAPEATYTDPLADVSGRDAIVELIGGPSSSSRAGRSGSSDRSTATTARPASPGPSGRTAQARRPSSGSTSSRSTTTA